MKAGRWLFPLLVTVTLGSPTWAAAQEKGESDSSFPLLRGLESAVEFWKRIFTEFSSSQLVYFDPLDMARIYEVVEVGVEPQSREYIAEERERVAEAHGVDVERVKAQRGIKERTASGLQRSGRYLGQIQQIFRDRGLPVELTYLPIVESSYELNARSSVGALGIWQFMPRTGREYMRVGAGIDERRDPLESSRAAASYLQQAHERLGNWPLAITSYNFGQAGIARAVAEVGSDNLVDLIEKYEHRLWGFPPKQFYAEFLAAVEIGTNMERYFPGLELDAAIRIDEVEVTSRSSLAAVIKRSGLNRNEFFGWNPALSPGTRFVPAGYRIKRPAEKDAAPLVQVAQKPAPAPPAKPRVVHHRVRQGETLSHIAQRYGASVQRIKEENNLRQAHLLRAGTTIRVPQI